MNNYQYVPWDAPKKEDWIKAFFVTLKNSLLKPMEFFEKVKEGDSFFLPLIYAIVIGMAVFIITLAYQLGFNVGMAGLEIPSLLGIDNVPEFFLSGAFLAIASIFMLLIGMPALTALGLLIEAAVLHLCLMILQGAKRDFKATFRTVCYCVGPQVFSIVPILGGIVSGFWVLALTIIGIKVVHDTSYGKSALAVFLPLLFCCGVIMLIVVSVAGGVLAALIAR